MGEKPVGHELAHYTSCPKATARFLDLATWVKLLLGTGQVTANGTSLAKRVVAAGGGSTSGAPDWCPNSLLDPYTPAHHILIFLSVTGLSFPFAFHYFDLALT